jgi:hypothetical protein
LYEMFILSVFFLPVIIFQNASPFSLLYEM